MEGKIRLLVVNNTKDANPSWTIRNKIVADALNEMGHQIDCNTRAAFMNLDDYDAVQFERFYEGSLKKEIEALKSIGKKIIYETDDNYNAVDQSHPFWKIRQYAKPSWLELMQLADAVIVSTTEIADEVRKMTGKEAYVIQNTLDFKEYPERKRKNKKLRIGFQGSNIHSGDILMVIDAIAELQKEHEFEFYIFGIDDKPLPELYQFVTDYPDKYEWTEEFRELYEKLQGMQYTHVPSVDYAAYRKQLAKLDLDIGICPLRDSSFNRAKSCLKFYEYAAVGTVALASKVIPYSLEMDDEDLAKNRYQNWKKKLEKLIIDSEHRKRRGASQRQWIHEHRNLHSMKFYWEKTYQKIILNKQ